MIRAATKASLVGNPMCKAHSKQMLEVAYPIPLTSFIKFSFFISSLS